MVSQYLFKQKKGWQHFLRKSSKIAFDCERVRVFLLFKIKPWGVEVGEIIGMVKFYAFFMLEFFKFIS
jgi:hypothetical protein